MTKLLSEAVKKRILSFGESSMGAYKVALVMRDGTIVEDVVVAWGDEVVRQGGHDPLSLDVDEVVDALDRSHHPRAEPDLPQS